MFGGHVCSSFFFRFVVGLGLATTPQRPAVNGQPTGTYEQTMAIIDGSPRPVSITFLDPMGLTLRGIMPGAGGGPPVQQQHSWVRNFFCSFLSPLFVLSFSCPLFLTIFIFLLGRGALKANIFKSSPPAPIVLFAVSLIILVVVL